MPYFPVSSRRSFLKSSLAAGVSYFALSRANAADATTAHWALLSDTHTPADPANEYRGFRPFDNLKKVVPQVLEAKPEGALIDGDLARLAGLPGDYANLKSLLAPLTSAMPVCMSLGNHDDRKNFLSAFPQPAYAQAVKDKHVSVIDAGPVRLVALDSLLYVDKVAGLLGKAQRAWLESFLAQEDGKATLLFVHHTLDDGDGSLLDVDRLFAIVRGKRQVKAIFYGHSHEWKQDRDEGIHLVNLPAVGYNFNDREPVGWVDARFTRQGAQLTLRAFGGNTAQHGQAVSLDWR